MKLRIGKYTHRVTEASISISRSPVENRMNQIVAYEEIWRITGKLLNPSTNSHGMDAVIWAFERAYSQDRQDLVLEHPDGRPSYQALYSRDCIGGTKIYEPPQFTQSIPREYVSFRSYSVVVGGLKPLRPGANVYLDFSESLSIRGGGARFGCTEVNNGPGTRQQLRTHSTCTASQSGSMTLFTGFPSPPPPIWPYALVDQYPDYEVGPPLSQGLGTVTNRSVSWSYNYAFPQRLYGEPHYIIG